MQYDYLNDLFYGNLDLDQQIDSKAIRQIVQEIVPLQEQLRAFLSPEEWMLAETLQWKLECLAGEQAERAFQVGFRTATQLIISGLHRQI